MTKGEVYRLRAKGMERRIKQQGTKTDRTVMRRKKKALSDMADNEDWLEGKPSPNKPKAHMTKRPEEKTERLSREDCQRKADECRKLASVRNMPDSHRIMLQHIAETWERLANEARKSK